MKHDRTSGSTAAGARAGRGLRAPRRLIPLLAAVAAVLGAAPASAQQGVIAGTVVRQQTLEPLSGAQVVVTGSGRGTITDATGRFRVEGVTGAEATLRVQMLGYRTETLRVAVGRTDLQVALAQDAIAIDGVVVTGTAAGQQKRSLGNVVAQISAAEVVESAPVQSLQDLVNGRAAGVVVMPGTGMVGGGAKIRVRGLSSLSLSGEPLIYVDGVRVNNSQGTGPTNQGFGSSVISRLNDFNPEDIESIEVIKGPAAATLYGTEAANGVIQIITKKGRAGEPRFTMSVKQGANWFANPEGRLYTNWGPDPRTGEVTSIDMYELEQSRGNDIFRTGRLQEYDLSLSGGTEYIQYYLGGNFERNEGIEPTNHLRQYSGRANVTVAPSEKLDVTASLGYVQGRTNLSVESGGGGVSWSTYFASPRRLYNADGSENFRRGFWSGTPEAYYRHYQDWQDIGRFTGSVQLNHRPTDWFVQRLAIGTDQTSQQDVELVERNDDLSRFFGSESQGYRDQTTRRVSYNSLDYSGTAIFDLTATLNSSTSLGAQYYSRFSEYVAAYGENFPAPGLRSISALTRDVTGGHDYVENTTVGVFVQQQLAWNNRLFLTGAVRADDNSAFGENFDLVYYPKVSAAWVLNEEPFFDVPWVSALKLRAAYGQSGQQPQSFAALRTFAPIPGPNDEAAVTPQLVGNPDLGPERGSEIELGFDAGFLNDRLGVELTYYDQTTKDAILLKSIAPSTGFSGSQYINAGEVSNSGIEILVRGTPVQSERLVWDASLSVATNANEVVSLGDPELSYVSGGTYIRHQVGYPVGSWFERRLVSAELDAQGRPTNVLCDDGQGGTVACSQAPHVYLGRNTPSLEGAVNTSLTFLDNLRVAALVDFKYGHSKLDGNRRVRCWFFSLCHENYFPAEHDPLAVAGSRLGIVSDLIKDSGFAKLREVSATYTLPGALAGRIGASRAAVTVAGRNLYTWTDYPGLEPEAMFLGGSRGYGSWEQNVIPQLAQFVASINLSF